MILQSAVGHGYARMTPVAVDVLLHPLPGGLLFVDVDVGDAGWDDAVAALRTLHPSVLSSASVLAFRSPIVRALRVYEVCNRSWVWLAGSRARAGGGDQDDTI